MVQLLIYRTNSIVHEECVDILIVISFATFNNAEAQIGNAVINDPTDTKGLIDYAWSHAIISDQLHDSIFKECDFSSSNTTVTLLCSSLFRDFLVAYSDIDIYSIYTPVCDLPDWSASQRLTMMPRLLTGHVRV